MKHDYGPYTPSPPTAKALATRDRLAEEMAAAPEGSEAQRAARKSLVGHILTEGLPLETFSTPSGRRFAVHVQRPKQLTQEMKHWLAGRDFGSAVRATLGEGRAVPFPFKFTVSEKK
jgi:hypothetical protein